MTEKPFFAVNAPQKRTFLLCSCVYFKCENSRNDSWIRILISAEQGFIIVIMRDASLWASSDSAVLRDRFYEIMKDLNQQINNWTTFFSLLSFRHFLTAKLCSLHLFLFVPRRSDLILAPVCNTWDDCSPIYCSLYSHTCKAGIPCWFRALPLKCEMYSPINEKIRSKQVFCITLHKLAYLFANGSNSLNAKLLRLQYFTLACETQERINMTCQTIEHNDLSLIPSARESLMFLL